MQLAQAQLEKHLSQGLKPLYVLVGDEPLAQRESLDTIRAAARLQGFDERTSLIVERYFNWQQIQSYGQSISLFASQRLLEINIPSGKPGVDGSKALQALAAKAIPDTTVVIILPTLEREAKNSGWFSTLENNAMTIALNEVDAVNLPKWIAGRLALQGQSASSQTLEFLAHQVEGNLLAANQEVQKLGLLYPQGELADATVREAVLNVSRYDAFQLGEAVLMGDAARTVRILQGLQDEGENAVAVMNPLMWVLRPLVRIKQAELRGENIMNAMTSARIYGDKQVPVKRALARLSLKQLEAALQKLADIDKTAKGVMLGNAWLEISRLCFGLAKVRGR
ncbi:DNA polymerase III subunit delta [Methylotenera sp.]|uniref:DNA polymerase III subunit delta n=1 Tax=Methylotenera sp. TaxID=2051956 RepID=UPI00272405F3|nr:DNA polymerase III subunit delta [Methylotenera sp.]MDO9205002.1 DNA polymerase III subunit delta [Methylotenera sp.]MDO9392638.1 DNA polymerase III subunit delta [Methylotenera sp.]MDP2071190.1 DNA polymerase III subunit delta [Methylotenera sp.]MDP3004589.1 DNA polymerase III subunit delta [Methylotenera sp.]